jgi:hypothetical protein
MLDIIELVIFYKPGMVSPCLSIEGRAMWTPPDIQHLSLRHNRHVPVMHLSMYFLLFVLANRLRLLRTHT